MYFFIWWTAMYAVTESSASFTAMIGVDCSDLPIKACISNTAFLSFNNFKQLRKKYFTSPVDSVSSQGLAWCWTSVMREWLHSGILMVAFLFSLACEHEASISVKSPQTPINVSFCTSKVGDFIVDFLTHSVVSYLALSSRASFVVNPLRVMAFRS